MNLSVKIGALTLQNPVTVASGTFGYGVEYSQLIDLNQLGAVVVKGIRLEPVRGNRTPRTVEVTSGLINAIGLQGPGVDGFIRKYWPFLKALKVPTIINIWGTTVEEYAEVARRFDALGGVGALELNVSCPNIKEGGAQFGTDLKLLSQVVAACRKATKLPLITKMSPNVVSIAPYAQGGGSSRQRRVVHHEQLPGDGNRHRDAPAQAGQRHGRPDGPVHQAHRDQAGLGGGQGGEDPNHRHGRHPDRGRRHRVPDGWRDRSGRRHGQLLRAADRLAGHRRPPPVHASRTVSRTVRELIGSVQTGK